MVVLYNNKKHKEIKIDDQHHLVMFSPRDYEEENPHVLIELKNINFQRHALNCEDCKAFCDDLGTNTTDWFIQWQTKTYRLNLSKLGKDHDQMLVSWNVGYYFTGTKLRLMISTETIEKLERELTESVEVENYEHCAFLRDRIELIKD